MHGHMNVKNNENTLVRPVGFTIAIILRCTALWTSKITKMI